MTKALHLPGLEVDPTWLVQHQSHPQLRIFDVRLRESYDEGHIPDAVWIDLSALTMTIDGVEGMLLPPADYARLLGELGIDDTKHVVLYDDNWGMPAARVLWGLARYGHNQAAILRGGWDRWQAEGRPHNQTPVTPEPTTFTIREQAQHLAERDWLLTQVSNPATVIVDVRTPNEYAQGHLPQAILWDWMNGVPIAGWDAFRPADKLLPELAELGVTPDKEVVVYCRSGARAAHTYLLLRILGFPNVRNYDGSWLDWNR
ncbi:MAG: sulfurtransferase [Chloroflexota bacterium]